MAKKGGLGSILGDIGGAYLGDQFGGKLGLSPQMGSALGGAIGGGLGGGGWGGAAEGAGLGYFGGGALDKGVNSLFSGVGSLFGGKNGIAPGSPAAMPAMGAQGAPEPISMAADPLAGLSTLGDQTITPASAPIPGITGPSNANPILMAADPLAGLDTSTPGLPAPAGAAAYAGAVPTAGGAAAGGAQGVMDKVLAGFKQNPMAALGLLGGLYQGLTPSPYSGELKSLANEERGLAKTYGQMTQGALQGKLPADAENYVQQMIRAQKARVASTYANMGMSGSTAEADDLNAVEASADALRFQIGQGMANTSGNIMENMSQGAQQLYSSLMQDSLMRNEALGQDIANYGAAFAKPQWQYVNGQWVQVNG